MFLRICKACLIPMLLLFASCGVSDSDVIATYVDGNKKINVTRGEFYKTFSRNPRYKRYILSNVKTQKQFLKNFVLKRLKSLDAVRSGMDKSEEYKKQLEQSVKNRLLFRHFLENRFPRPMKKFSMAGSKIRHIIIKRSEYKTVTMADPNRFKRMQHARKTIKDTKKLQKRLAVLAKATIRKRVKLTPFELAKHEREIKAKITKIEAELKKKGPASFAQLARQYSEDAAKMRGGDLGYIFPHHQRMDRTFVEAALKLKAGQVSPILNTSFGYHLIKCDAIVTFTDKNFGDYFPTKEEKKQLAKAKGKAKSYAKRRIDYSKKRQMHQIWISSVWAYIDDTLANDKNVVNNRSKLGSPNLKTVVFAIKHPEYKFTITKGDLVNELKKYPPRRLLGLGIKRTEKDKNKPFTAAELEGFYDVKIAVPILNYGAYKFNVVKTAKFKKAVEDLKPSILSRLFDEKARKSIKITDKEIQAEYKKFPKRYKNYLPGKYKAPKFGKNKGMGRLQAKKLHATNILRNQKFTKLMDKLRKALMKRYQFKINEKELEIVKQKMRPRRGIRRRRPIMKRVTPKKNLKVAPKKGAIKKKK